MYISNSLVLVISQANYAQIPNLCTASSFALFTGVGAVTYTGISNILGNVGTNAGAYTGSPFLEGQIHVQDVISS